MHNTSHAFDVGTLLANYRVRCCFSIITCWFFFQISAQTDDRSLLSTSSSSSSSSSSLASSNVDTGLEASGGTDLTIESKAAASNVQTSSGMVYSPTGFYISRVQNASA